MFELVSVYVASSMFVVLLFVVFVAVSRVLLGQERLYSKIYKKIPFAIIIPTDHEK